MWDQVIKDDLKFLVSVADVSAVCTFDICCFQVVSHCSQNS